MNEILSHISKLNDTDRAAAYVADRALRTACYAVMNPAKATERAQLAAALAEAFQATVTPEPPAKEPDKKMEPHPKHDERTRNMLLRFLADVGTQAEVPAIAGVLGELNLREMARYALQAIGGTAATTALIGTLEACGPEFRIGVINTLADLGGADAAAAIRAAAKDADTDVRIAAIEALAALGDPANDAIIAKACDGRRVKVTKRAMKARLRLAANLAEQGNAAAAKRIYEALARTDTPQAKAAKLALKQH
ncbi:MAG: HEAT repeat domain-containing protein [Phycisphaerae bacterium]|nr:HEAT repeat domain-containing protein [Phycisphaerae bacterium]